MRWRESGGEMKTMSKYSSMQWHIPAVQPLRRLMWGMNPVHYYKTNLNNMRPCVKKKQNKNQINNKRQNSSSLYVSMWSTENEMFQPYPRNLAHKVKLWTLCIQKQGIQIEWEIKILTWYRFYFLGNPLQGAGHLIGIELGAYIIHVSLFSQFEPSSSLNTLQNIQ